MAEEPKEHEQAEHESQVDDSVIADPKIERIRHELQNVESQIKAIVNNALNTSIPELNTKLQSLNADRSGLKKQEADRIEALATEWKYQQESRFQKPSRFKKAAKQAGKWVGKTVEFFKAHPTELKWAAGAASLALLTPPGLTSGLIWIPFGAAGWAYGAYRKAHPKEAAPAHEHSEASHGSPH